MTTDKINDGILWCVHHIGPDDVHPAPDFETAQNWADYANNHFKADGVLSRFVVAPWDGGVQDHAEGLEASVRDWTLPEANPWKSFNELRAENERLRLAAGGNLPFTMSESLVYQREGDNFVGDLLSGQQIVVHRYWIAPIEEASRMAAQIDKDLALIERKCGQSKANRIHVRQPIIAADVQRLVLAARVMAQGDWDELSAEFEAARNELDQAGEAFADRIPWDEQPEEGAA